MLSQLSTKQKNIAIVLAVIALSAIVLTLSLVLKKDLHYVVSVDGQPLGYVAEEEQVEQILSVLAENKSEELATATDVVISNDITITKETEETELEELNADQLAPLLEYSTQAAIVVIDGEQIFGLPTKEVAQEVVDLIVQGYTSPRGSRELKDYEVLEEIDVVEGTLALDKFVDRNTAINLLSDGYKVTRTHVVTRGESLWTIARNNDLKVSELKEANPQVNGNLIKPGQELKLQVPQPYIHVKTLETVKEIQYQSYKTKTEYDSSMYVWESKTKVAGVRGKTEITYEIELINGKEESRKKLGQQVLSEPVTRVIVKGTKMPNKVGTGQFAWPILDNNGGMISCYFGWTGTRYHHGLDIAAPRGTPIHASDGGTVVKSGYYGTYGRMVEIEHGNGYTTRYAHCDKLLVKVGQTVDKHDKIALLGNTGKSTGPHVHFEIRKNGDAKNPLSYFKK